ncbi:hypothetical protein FSP39_015872 [Pinctada imbricata]|uniref:Transposase Tc1-like domain-containing protein n=1 Tax=Pinctada imbricata TaxID=66713 RepID=A0AA88YUY6_PINIB|nr:hypothetical protein FSP39_015872 [Pinctada imbricata]
MGVRPSLSTARAIGMLETGQSSRSVDRQFGVHHSTIVQLKDRFPTTALVQDRPRCGRPRKRASVQDRLVKHLTLWNRKITARTLQTNLQRATGIRVSDQTIRNRLRAENLRSRKAAFRIPLTPRHRRVRLEWCWRHSRCNLRQWSQVCFIDESRFNVRSNDGRFRGNRREGERYANVNFRQHDRYGGGSIMVWGGNTLNKRTQLYVANSNLNGNRYLNEILRPIILLFLTNIGQNADFQHDNARPHRARAVKDFIQKNNIVRMFTGFESNRAY